MYRDAFVVLVFHNRCSTLFVFQNSALFWYNYRLSGEAGDLRTLHGGCPVLYGQKWGTQSLISLLYFIYFINIPQVPCNLEMVPKIVPPPPPIVYDPKVPN